VPARICSARAVVAGSGSTPSSWARTLWHCSYWLTAPPLLAQLRQRINACLQKKRWHDKEQAYLAEIEAGRTRSDRLLLNILPQLIAEGLKHKEETIVDRFPEVTVLFADLASFTAFLRVQVQQRSIESFRNDEKGTR
jgi:hypothetical protein